MEENSQQFSISNNEMAASSIAEGKDFCEIELNSSRESTREGGKQGSPASLGGPICRICHDTGAGEPLFAPCKCLGSLAMTHISCLERWLSMSNSTTCEICKFAFQTCRKPRPVSEWFANPDTPRDMWNLISDLVCFCILTPLAIVSAYLCAVGASHYMTRKTLGWEASGLIALSVILTSVYLVWLIATIRHHLKVMNRWRASHQFVELLSVRELDSNQVQNDNNNNRSSHC